MSPPILDIVTVFHSEKNRQQALELEADLAFYADVEYSFVAVDNSIENRGFAAACNLGAGYGAAPFIGFLNPDVVVQGRFMRYIVDVLRDNRNRVIAGERFDKPQRELKIWGCREWVCGAAFFVKRKWFQEVGGFDERFIWSHEETDLIRRAQEQGKEVRAVFLPILHESPTDDSPEDVAYKAKYFEESRRRFNAKWGTNA